LNAVRGVLATSRLLEGPKMIEKVREGEEGREERREKGGWHHPRYSFLEGGR